MAEIDLFIAGRSYRVACRDGEEDALRKAAALVDAKSREALAGLGTLSEAPEPPPAPALDPALADRAERLAERLESLARGLEAERSHT
jgi:cell division protein ZapA